MDGAASIIAVVSLTLQLVQTIDTIKAFVRDIKSASKELERLAELLDRLEALLQDIRDVMERQTSLRDFPLPSNTIFACLKSCKKSLGLLEDIIKKYGSARAQGGKSSTVSRLKDDMKLAFRAKDIATFEARIQRDINDLHTALGTNTTNILTTVLPIVLRKQDTVITSSSIAHTPHSSSLSGAFTSVKTTSCVQLAPHKSSTKICQEWVQSPLERFGIRQRRTHKYVCLTSKNSKPQREETKAVASEYYDTFVCWQILGYARRVSLHYPYGSILPSLRVAPLVETTWIYREMIRDGTLTEIQQAFEADILHPFVVDVHGYTLLHHAVSSVRPEVCRLLQGYGLRPELTAHGISPLTQHLWKFQGDDFTSRLIDTLRIMLLEFDQIDEDLGQVFMIQSSVLRLDAVEWLWFNAAQILHDTEVFDLRKKLAQRLVGCLDPYYYERNERAMKLLLNLMDAEMIDSYRQGRYALLPSVWIYPFDSLDSACGGKHFLELLRGLRLDVEACVQQEIRNLPNGMIPQAVGYPERRVILEKSQSETMVLRWEWLYDSLLIGHLVVSEFSALAGDAFPDYYGSGWPFLDFSTNRDIPMDNENSEFRTPVKILRFARRTATRLRKERARTGQKRPRSRMPGAWI